MTKVKTTSVIEIPIYPHLKKFYLKTYELTEPVKLEEDNILGNYVMSVLQDKRKTIVEATRLSKSEELTDTIGVELSTEMAKRSPRMIKLIRINIFLKHMFRHSVIVYIKASGKSGTNPFNACKNFLSSYNFDDSEFSLDAVHKIWLRHNKTALRKKKSS